MKIASFWIIVDWEDNQRHGSTYSIWVVSTLLSFSFVGLICIYPHSVNSVVPPSEVIPSALDVANQIIQNSPDSVQATKVGLLMSQKHNHSEMLQTHVWSPESKRVYKGENIKVRFCWIHPFVRRLWHLIIPRRASRRFLRSVSRHCFVLAISLSDRHVEYSVETFTSVEEPSEVMKPLLRSMLTMPL